MDSEFNTVHRFGTAMFPILVVSVCTLSGLWIHDVSNDWSKGFHVESVRGTEKIFLQNLCAKLSFPIKRKQAERNAFVAR